MFTQSDSKFGCQEWHFLLRGAVILAGSVAVRASKNQILQPDGIPSNCWESSAPNNAIEWNDPKAEQAYSQLEKCRDDYNKAITEYSRLRTEIDDLLDHKIESADSLLHPSRIKHLRKTKQFGFEQTIFGDTCIMMPRTQLKAQEYTQICRKLKTDCIALEGSIRNLKRHMKILENPDKLKQKGTFKPYVPKRSSRAVRKSQEETHAATRNKGLNERAEREYNHILSMWKFYKEQRPVYEKSLKKLNETYENFGALNRDDVSATKTAFVYQAFDTVKRLKEGMLLEYEQNPFKIVEMPKLPSKGLSVGAYTSLCSSYVRPKQWLEKAIKQLNHFTKSLHEAESFFPTAAKITKTQRDETCRHDYGDLVRGSGKRRRRLPAEHCEPSTASANGSLGLVPFLILFLLCAFVVQRFIRSKRRASDPEVRRLSLNAAETMV